MNIKSGKKKLRFGILSTGNIANQFAQGVLGAERAVVQAVAARNHENAIQFAAKYNIPSAHKNYDALLADPDVDAVYIGLPNNMHHEWTIRALNAGKHVLCEKPFAVNEQQATEMFAHAERKGLLLAEAFMFLTHPLTKAWQHEIQSGTIGEIKLIRSSFSFAVNNPNTNSRFNTELAGGSIMDIGCYCTTLALLVANAEPASIYCSAHIHESGVDDYAAGILHFPNNLIASFVCGMTAQCNNTTYICGSKGYIEIPVPWKPPLPQSTYIIDHNIPAKQDKKVASNGLKAAREVKTVNCDKPLYGVEADAFAEAVLDSKPMFISPEFTLRNTRILEKMRSEINLPY